MVSSTPTAWCATGIERRLCQALKTGRAAALATSVLGTAFALWLVYAAGLKYLFLAAIFLACGIPVFIWARKQKKDGKPIFAGSEKAVVTILALVALAAIYAFSRGLLKI